MRIAIVGAGIAGLGTAWLLNRAGHPTTLYEANGYLGGHTHTVDVRLEGITHPVDTGFLVYNDRTYPLLAKLFAELGVESVASEMSFSCRVDACTLEWSGTDLPSLFAQRSNAMRPAFLRMLVDVVRFNREARSLTREDAAPTLTLGEHLERSRYGRGFRDWYLIPMAAAIWSSPKREILEFPLTSFTQFCHNHGLLQLTDRPQWRTVRGGGRTYVERIVSRLPDVRMHSQVRRVARKDDGVEVTTQSRGTERFDAIVLACHSDEALALLSDPSTEETRLLKRARYQRNHVVLHTDDALLPHLRRAWSAWNYLAAHDPAGTRPVAVSYLINRLQPLPFRTPVIVTLNPPFDPDPRRVIDEFAYWHPLQDAAALTTQGAIASLQGVRRTWYAGAWLGYGFHEDGLRSAHAVCESIASDLQRRARLGHARIAA